MGPMEHAPDGIRKMCLEPKADMRAVAKRPRIC